ncbi:suppressor of fused domain protein [Paenibacillus turpanensis]|uniref:suppressor of fused domain protein n=1 Tax=Paenibacillus turpanensis TaxID=2689078 RepID=UPI00140E3EFF|nr:suppressor of fused domain protein [Paenibacillus turpanensis]
MHEEANEEAKTYGWDAIELAMGKLYGEQEPKHYGTLISYMLGGPDPLEGISAYKAEEPVPHWHFVTFGFSELYEKESDDAEHSGYGFELTFRLKREENEEEPPGWALNLLQNMGRYVFNSGNIFRPGDYLDANGPICLGEDTELTALAFVEDPELPEADTPNGRVQFLQMVGITRCELEAMQIWNTRGLLKTCEEYMPRYLTDLARDSFMRMPEVADAVQQGMERDGSSTGFLYVDQLGWEPAKKRLFGRIPASLRIGAKQAEIVGKLLAGRILKEKSLYMTGPDIQVVFEPGEKAGFEEGEDEVRIRLDKTSAAELSRVLQPKEGAVSLSSFKGLTVQIVKTYIKDQDGNVVTTIG